MKKTVHKVTLFYRSIAFGRVPYSWASDMWTCDCLHSIKYPSGSDLARIQLPLRCYRNSCELIHWPYSQLSATLSGNIVITWSAKGSYLKPMYRRLTTKIVTQWCWMKDNDLVACNYIQAGISRSHQVKTTLGTPESPSRSYPYSTNHLPASLVPSAPPPEDTSNK